jgi:exosortase/archaeosortase family protein
MDRAYSRFVAVLAVFGVVVFLTYRDEVLAGPLTPLALWTAETTVRLLNLLGIEASRQSTVVYDAGGFAYEVYFRCTGVLPVATFVVALLSFPRSSWRRRLIGLTLGVPLILAVNYVRLAHLYQLGVHRPELFPRAHSVLWELAIVLLVAVAWLTWTAWAVRPGNGASQEVPA